MLKEFEFGSEAIIYVQSCLSSGNTLSRRLLKLTLGSGRVTAHLPANVSPVTAREFEFGGIAKGGENPWSHLAAFIAEYLSGQGKRYAVFEAIERKGDPCVSSLDKKFFTHGSELYFFLTSRDQDLSSITGTIRAARSYPFVGALTSVPEDEPDIRADFEVTTDVLEKLAARTEHILIGAYDDEGVLIWSERGY
jgi:hypothetical protein